MFVVDASVALASCFSDEASEAADRALDHFLPRRGQREIAGYPQLAVRRCTAVTPGSAGRMLRAQGAFGPEFVGSIGGYGPGEMVRARPQA